jgi:predicted HAD superfamily Cof-like phosphohydrolase
VKVLGHDTYIESRGGDDYLICRQCGAHDHDEDNRLAEPCPEQAEDGKRFVSLPESGLDAAVRDLVAFHTACDVPVHRVPHWPPEERVDLRMKLMAEEWKELNDAWMGDDMVEVSDAIADLIYVLLGTALELGIPIADVWREVHSTNMAKVDPATGKVRRRADGKVLKPEGWRAPDIARILRQHWWQNPGPRTEAA